MTLAVTLQNRLVDMRINREIDADIFAGKQTDLCDRIARLKLQMDIVDRSHDEMCHLAVKVLELSQVFRQRSLTSDYLVKRRYWEIVILNLVLDHVTLVLTTRTPVDVVADGCSCFV